MLEGRKRPAEIDEVGGGDRVSLMDALTRTRVSDHQQGIEVGIGEGAFEQSRQRAGAGHVEGDGNRERADNCRRKDRSLDQRSEGKTDIGEAVHGTSTWWGGRSAAGESSMSSSEVL